MASPWCLVDALSLSHSLGQLVSLGRRRRSSDAHNCQIPSCNQARNSKYHLNTTEIRGSAAHPKKRQRNAQARQKLCAGAAKQTTTKSIKIWLGFSTYDGCRDFASVYKFTPVPIVSWGTNAAAFFACDVSFRPTLHLRANVYVAHLAGPTFVATAFSLPKHVTYE